MQRVALGVACLVVFSGCLAASASTESAMNLEDQARERADEQLDDPRLVGLWGIETPAHAENNETELTINLDDEPGDGNAAGWAYRFLGDQRTGVVVVADEIGVVAEFWTDLDDDEDDESPEALSWDVDSEEAAATLADNGTWPAMTEAHAVSWELEDGDDRTVWEVEAEEVNFSGHGEEAEAEIDARTGEILEVHRDDREGLGPDVDGPEDPDPPDGGDAEREGGCDTASESGTLTPLDDLEAGPVDLGGHGSVAVFVDYDGAGPLDLQLVRDEDEVVFDDGTTMAGSGSYQDEVGDLPPGEYELTASTDSGTAQVDVHVLAAWGEASEACPTADVAPPSGAGEPPAWVWAGRTLGVNSLR